MRITSKDSALHVLKPEGINVGYYLFEEYEIHYNEQAPHSTQVWHHHEKVWETLFIIEGELIAKWKENGEEKEQICYRDRIYSAYIYEQYQSSCKVFSDKASA